MRYAGIIYDDIANGEHLGAVFFTQGCPHHCSQCHNKHTWNPKGGKELTEDIIDDLFNYFVNTPFAKRLTLSGGDPFFNYELSLRLAKQFKELFSSRVLWIYTGYNMEYLLENEKYRELLELADVVVDGQFDMNRRDITLEFRGSSNQNIWRKEKGQWMNSTK